MALPLEGIRVLDFCSYIAGPYCPALLGDLGAEVIKIEAHRGDQTRYFPSTLKGETRMFLGANRNKQGIVLDLKQEAARQIIYKLAKAADVVVENFRPGVSDRLKIGYAELSAINPRLIYCSISGYGSCGPMQTRPGFDQVLQAMTGIAVSQGGEGAPQVQAGSVVDYYTATLAAYGVMTALFVRERTGIGQKVETSLLQGALAMQSGRFIWADHEGREAKRDLAGGINRIFKTKLGHIYISAHTETFWQSLCQTIGRSDLGTDQRYNSMSKRSQHVKELVVIVEEALQAKSAEEWEELLSVADVPCSVARPIEDMFDHPQVKALDMVAQVTHPVVGGMRMLGVPITFSQMPSRVQQPAPTLGEHTQEILHSLGYTADQVAEL
ncbi:MAG: CaiB/BaiF CoA transferase family protein, partial [Candidatus Entotheonellia bacterium]